MTDLGRRAVINQAGGAELTRPEGARPIYGERYRQVAFKLPVASLAIIDGECSTCGWGRATLLELLLLHKLGKVKFARRESGPIYRFEPEDWTTSRRYIWHQRAELHALFDGLLLRLGNLSPRAWVVLAVNEFVGLPTWSPGNDAARAGHG